MRENAFVPVDQPGKVEIVSMSTDDVVSKLGDERRGEQTRDQNVNPQHQGMSQDRFKEFHTPILLDDVTLRPVFRVRFA